MASPEALWKKRGWLTAPLALAAGGALGMGINGAIVSQLESFHPPWADRNLLQAIGLGSSIGLALGTSILIPRVWVSLLVAPAIAILLVVGQMNVWSSLEGFPMPSIRGVLNDSPLMSLALLVVPLFAGIHLLFLRFMVARMTVLVGIPLFVVSGLIIGSLWDHLCHDIMRNYFPLRHFYGAIFGIAQYLAIMAVIVYTRSLTSDEWKKTTWNV